MYFGAEGLIQLIGAVLFAVGFPILVFKDTFDPAKKPTSTEMISGLVASIGLIYVAMPFVMTGGRILLSALH